jgi:hypothetical protein
MFWKISVLTLTLCFCTALPAQTQDNDNTAFFVSDYVRLHLEGTDAEVAILEQMASTLRHLLEQAVLVEGQKPWTEIRHLTLRLNADIVHPPFVAALSLEDQDQIPSRRSTRVFYYNPNNEVDFSARLQAYLWRTLGVRFHERPRQAQVSSQVQLHLKAVDTDLPDLRALAALVREVLEEASPPASMDYPPRRLELKLDTEIVMPPFRAGLSLSDLDAREEERTVQVFYYDPGQRQAFKHSLRAYLTNVLAVHFPAPLAKYASTVK